LRSRGSRPTARSRSRARLRPAPRRRSGSSSPFLLVRADELALREDVTAHRREELVLGGRREGRQGHVERVELEEVAVAADGPAGPAVAGALPVVLARARAGGQRAALGQPGGRGGGGPDPPVDPGGLG